MLYQFFEKIKSKENLSDSHVGTKKRDPKNTTEIIIKNLSFKLNFSFLNANKVGKTKIIKLNLLPIQSEKNITHN